MRIVLLCPDYPPRRGGLADHTQHLAESLMRFGACEVTVLTTRSQTESEEDPSEGFAPRQGPRVRRAIASWGWRGIVSLMREIARASPEWVLVQYVPHMYGRGGVNLAFPLALLAERLAGRRFLLLVHELYSDFPPRFLPFTHALAALGQRLMFWLAASAAHRIAVSIEPWKERLEAARWMLGRSRLFYLPSPSNIELQPIRRQDARRKLGISEGEIVLSSLGTGHVSKRRDWMLGSLEALLADGMAARLLLIGPESEEVLSDLSREASAHLRPHLLLLGYVSPEEVSHALQASDIFLLPTSDGVSTRRSSLMAALSHGLAVVGTIGRLTDGVLQSSEALMLVPAGDREAFIGAVRTLAHDAARRRELGRRGQDLYRERFSWPVITARLLAVLREGENGIAQSKGA